MPYRLSLRPSQALAAWCSGNFIEPVTDTTESDRAQFRQACEHKIALHVDAAIDVVDTDPVEADAWAYEGGKEAWEFDLQVPEKLASHPALSAAFKRGFDSVEQQARTQRDVQGNVQEAVAPAVTKKFLVPTFVVVEADSKEAADDLVGNMQRDYLEMGVSLYLDETLPTVQVDASAEREFFTVLDEPEVMEAVKSFRPQNDSLSPGM